MNAVHADVEALVIKELSNANKKFPQFASRHEGCSVAKEELEEAYEAIDGAKHWHESIWQHIKLKVMNPVAIENCKNAAIHAACECIQLAAMCQKMIDFENGGKYTL
jgi:hypothetical protein